MNRFLVGALAGVVLVGAGQVRAALVVNAARPITDRVNVNLIAVADDGGANSTAGMLGNATQQSQIFSYVDTIYAQAGIDVDFTFRSGTFNNSFTRTGTPGANNPRSTNDLSTIGNIATTAGVLSLDFNTINVFLVSIVPGFSQLGTSNSAGLAWVGGNGVTYYGGSGLLGSTTGREILASVLAHEIGHNLGLDHASGGENLMASGSGGQRLDAGQISTVLASRFSVPAPAPTTDGDFNNNNFVDGSDLLLWQRGGSPTRLSRSDLNVWRTNFGKVVSTVAASAVPEPGSLVVGVLGIIGFLRLRRAA